MKLFLDCEFTQLSPAAKLISLALVAEDGSEFYAELPDSWHMEDCSDFVVEIVLPQLWGGSYSLPIIDARVALLSSWPRSRKKSRSSLMPLFTTGRCFANLPMMRGAGLGMSEINPQTRRR